MDQDVYELYVIMYHKYIKQLIVWCKNIIYGTMTEILIYYKKFRNSLGYEGYEFNPYDPCLSKMIIKGSQMTVCFHLDDWNLSHKIRKVLRKKTTWLKK